MSGLAFQYLREAAEKHAREAISADRSGDFERALRHYKIAYSALEKILRLYPNSPAAPLYASALQSYKRRIEQLEKKAAELLVTGSSEDGAPSDHGLPESCIVTEKPEVRFDDVVDLEQAKRALRESIIYPTKRPDLYPLGWPKGILLFGPPGCGKTLLAAALARELDGIFLYVDAAKVMSKWLGEAEKNVAKIFAFAREKSEKGVPVVIFIDEVEDLLGVYSSEVGGEARVRTQFLKEMDGLRDKGKKSYVYVIGATNKPWKLDEAFIRRFHKRIYVPPPDRETRAKLFEKFLRGLNVSEDVLPDRLADYTEGYSSSDIEDIVREAHSKVVSEFLERGGEGTPRPVTMSDFLEVIRARRPSLDDQIVKKIEAWAREYEAL
ncbi:MAG: ATP-binding protein [Fervidicoccaceae archaeon]